MAGTSSGVHRTGWLPRFHAEMATDRAAEAYIPQSVPVPAERVRPGNCHHRNAAWTRVEPLSCLRRAGDTQYAGSLSPQGAIPALLRDTTQLVSHVRCVSASEGEKTGDADSPRFFIHPYFDVFVAEQVVELKLFPPYDKPAFTVSSREGLPEVHGKLVDSHIRELAIAERYLHFFRGQHRRLLRLVQGLDRKSPRLNSSH